MINSTLCRSVYVSGVENVFCIVYKSPTKADTYLYVDRQTNLEPVPEQLLSMLGSLEKVLEFDLATIRTLARADLETVRKQIREQGFYLQMPPKV